MERKIMVESRSEAKTQLALDTDWTTAAFAAFGFAFSLLTIGATARSVLIGAPVQTRIKWETVFLFLIFAWLAIRLRERVTKFGCILWTIVFGSRIILAIIHASAQIQVINGQIMRVVDLLVMVGFCFY